MARPAQKTSFEFNLVCGQAVRTRTAYKFSGKLPCARREYQGPPQPGEHEGAEV